MKNFENVSLCRLVYEKRSFLSFLRTSFQKVVFFVHCKLCIPWEVQTIRSQLQQLVLTIGIIFQFDSPILPLYFRWSRSRNIEYLSFQ